MWEKYRNTDTASRDEVKQDKAQRELNLAKHVKEIGASISSWATKGEVGKMWTHCSTRQGIWLQREWKRRKNLISSEINANARRNRCL